MAKLNDKVRWMNAANIANLEFQFGEWHKNIINDKKEIARQNMKQQK